MTVVSWHGLAADYTDAERTTMRTLARVDTATARVIHELKALCGAQFVEPGEIPPHPRPEPPDQLRIAVAT